MPVVIGFSSDYLLQRHFHDHGEQFGATTKEEYLAMAKTFLEADLADNPDILECIKKDGNIARFNPRTDEYAIMTLDRRYIKTYFKPIPRHLNPLAPWWLTHRFPNNISYFTNDCR